MRAAGELAHQWLFRPRGPQAGEFKLNRRRIYVLPTRAGLSYGVVLLLMLITSINYSLSLGYGLTFLLASIALVCLLQTFRNLASIGLRPGKSDPVFAGEMAELQLVVRNRNKIERYALSIHAPAMGKALQFDLAGDTEQNIVIALPTQQRGRQAAPRLSLWTTWPLGLWRAWSYWHPALSTTVYPRPESPAQPLPELTALPGESSGSGSGMENFAAIRPYVEGDSPRRLAWRAMARSANDHLLTKQFDGGYRGELWLRWNSLTAQMTPEARLERLCRWVLAAEAAGARYGLALPNIEIAIDHGPAQRTRCLEALAAAEV